MHGTNQVQTTRAYCNTFSATALGEGAVVGDREPLLSYATGEITRITADLFEYIQKVHAFVDAIEGGRPMPISPGASNKYPEQPPMLRGEALKEAVRRLQEVRNDAADAVSRLSAI